MSNTKRNTKASKPAATKASKPAASETAAQRKVAALSKANAVKTAQPGIISAIMSLLCDARDKKQPVTVNGMLDTLEAKFGRPRAGMLVTVRAQLSRLPHERNFGIVKTRLADSVHVAYAADAKAKANAAKVAAA